MRVAHMRVARSFLVLACLLAASSLGCASLEGAGIFQVDSPKIKDAIQRKDVDYCRKVCDGKIRARYESDKRDACNFVKENDATAGLTCENAVQRYTDAPGSTEFNLEMAKYFAKCGLYTDLFERIAYYGGEKALITVEDAGFPLEAEFVKYAQGHAGPKFLALTWPKSDPVYFTKGIMENISRWLIGKGHLGQCAMLAAAVKDASETAQVWAMPYFNETKCKQAAPIVVGLLGSNVAQHRVWACASLAEIGDASMLRKVAILAETDTFSEVREQRGGDGRVWGSNVYPVREACTAAAGKIRLRSN